ncbi:MAG: aldo/keto reductase, partial [Alphaproteobacteria bacterium]|nr:aldo/keto reductase [Alphaproteobacteria bacterium]
MTLPAASRYQLTSDLEICRILNGMWQVSGAHGPIDRARAVDEMFRYHEAGFTTWDLADHYGPAEDLIGEFRRRFALAHGAERLGEIQAFTKWVPYPGAMTRPIVEQAVQVSLGRMGVDCLDLLQFHWWDYADRRYLDALKHLADLRDEGKIRHLALTNFDTERLQTITEAGIRIISNQVQYSLVDRRPAARMVAFCQQQGIALLTYGTVLGGFLSEKYLGQREPMRGDLATASLQKYKHMVDAWGGWGLFQELLAALKRLADRHGVGIANIGQRYILEQPAVAGVIVGARLGIAEHIAANAQTFNFVLDEADHTAIEPILAKSRDLMQV